MKQLNLIEEITSYTDIPTRILIALATVGTASDGQLARLCLALTKREEYQLFLGNKPDEKYAEVLNQAERLKNIEGLVGKKEEVKLPRQMGGGVCDIWYLTKKGAASLEIINPFFTRYIPNLTPMNVKSDRYGHELAVTESFLKLNEMYQILDYIPERELKKRIMKRRHELLKQGINPHNSREQLGEETGDFRIIYLPKRNQNHELPTEVECEAAINYRRAQIEAKPEKMMWFVTSNTQKEIVETVKKGKLKQTVILGSIRQPFDTNSNEPEKEKVGKHFITGKNRLEKKLNEYLYHHAEAFTVRALAVILREQKSHISTILSRLQGSGLVVSEEIKLTPSRHKGRPNKLFWHINNDEKTAQSRESRLRSLILSETISFLCEKEYRFIRYSKDTGKAEFLPLDTRKNSPLNVLIDDTEIPTDELRKRTAALTFHNQTAKAELLTVIGTEERYESVQNFFQNNLILIAEKKRLIRPKLKAGG